MVAHWCFQYRFSIQSIVSQIQDFAVGHPTLQCLSGISGVKTEESNDGKSPAERSDVRYRRINRVREGHTEVTSLAEVEAQLDQIDDVLKQLQGDKLPHEQPPKHGDKERNSRNQYKEASKQSIKALRGAKETNGKLTVESWKAIAAQDEILRRMAVEYLDEWVASSRDSQATIRDPELRGRMEEVFEKERRRLEEEALEHQFIRVALMQAHEYADAKSVAEELLSKIQELRAESHHREVQDPSPVLQNPQDSWTNALRGC
jgi:hypothetical protein